MNAIVLLADDLGWSDVSYHGGDIPTPNIDALAAKSVRNEQFYAQPICTPSRAAIMTGKYPFRYGLQQIVWPWNRHGLSSLLHTMPQVLHKFGYSTYCVGKWNLGHCPVSIPTNKGFDLHYGCYTGGIEHYDHTSYGVHDFVFNARPFRPVGHSADIYTNKACELIIESRNKPFFMYLPYNTPHLPYQYPDQYEARVSHIKDERRRKYTAMVMHLDDCVGRITTCLREQGRDHDTAIWFSSDNGGWVDYAGSNGPFRGGKISYEEGGVRVVNFTYLPGVAPSENRSVGHLVDVFPTLLSLMGLPEVQGLDGIDQSSYMKGEQAAKDREIVLGLFESHASFRWGDWKYINVPEYKRLYNLADDPYELKPIDNPTIIARFESRHEALKKSYVPDPPNTWIPPYGIPPGYQMPSYWGENSDQPIQMASVDYYEPQNVKELLGYHPSLKI